MSRRAFALAALLVVVLYASAWILAYNQENDLLPGTMTDQLPGGQVAHLLLAPIASLVLVALSRARRDLSLKVLWSYWAGLAGSVALVLTAWRLDRPAGALLSPGSIAVEMTQFWLTFALLIGLATFSFVHPPSRSRMGSLVAMPVLVWAWTGTVTHLRIFEGGHIPSQFFWLLAIVTVIALLLLFGFLVLWTAAIRARWSQAAQLVVLTTVLTVVCDWGMTLFAISTFQEKSLSEQVREGEKALASRVDEAVEKRLDEVACEPTAVPLSEIEVTSGDLRARFRPLLIGCAGTCLSDKRKDEVRATLADIVRQDIEREYALRDAPSRRKQLAHFVEEKMGCTIAKEIILGNFSLETY